MHTSLVGFSYYFILQIDNLKLREAQYQSQGQTANKLVRSELQTSALRQFNVPFKTGYFSMKGEKKKKNVLSIYSNFHSTTKLINQCNVVYLRTQIFHLRSPEGQVMDTSLPNSVQRTCVSLLLFIIMEETGKFSNPQESATRKRNLKTFSCNVVSTGKSLGFPVSRGRKRVRSGI